MNTSFELTQVFFGWVISFSTYFLSSGCMYSPSFSIVSPSAFTDGFRHTPSVWELAIPSFPMNVGDSGQPRMAYENLAVHRVEICSDLRLLEPHNGMRRFFRMFSCYEFVQRLCARTETTCAYLISIFALPRVTSRTTLSASPQHLFRLRPHGISQQLSMPAPCLCRFAMAPAAHSTFFSWSESRLLHPPGRYSLTYAARNCLSFAVVASATLSSPANDRR